jgi:alkanesulfonate monooxygenase SsuD/methylene tetrahydromethanopterin reductase-like flavin-dependent oxidoreductase (luciferase family)
VEIGLYTFADITPDWRNGRAIGVEQRYREILAAAKLADDAGFAVFGVGEHHRPDIAISSPAVVLAAVAAATKRIRLTSAVSILSTLDPVRVFQDFATVDLVSGGRVEIIAGRGAFFESFALFGHDVADYDALFAEKLDLLLKIRAEERVTWQGRFRPPLNEAAVTPRPVQTKLPVWMGAGGNPETAQRAAELGMPLILANISKPPATFAAQFVDYRKRGRELGHDAASLRTAVATHLFVAEDSRAARDEFYPYYSAYFANHAPKTSYAAEVPRPTFDERAGPKGAIFVGSPQEIVDKLGYEHELFGHDRFLAQIDIGGQPYAMVARTIELLAVKVLPSARAL